MVVEERERSPEKVPTGSTETIQAGEGGGMG